MRSVVTGLILITLAAGVAACDGPARTARPSPSLIVLDFSPRPSGTATASATPGTSVAGWPLGWDASFCAMFRQAVDAQQLLVDVERAMDEGDDHDARLLADELTQSANGAEDAIATLPEWSGATPTLVSIAGLMDLGSRAGTEYHAWFADGKRVALRRARDLRTENGTQVPSANVGLEHLADAGLACQDTPLVLEAPG
ncbi:MAG TPA: hypothetical protein VM284_04730 [Candidatus Limnocylindria bacterium]|nr:hypothetical protein [Candidatus Limnocylindria bacterium]